MSKKWQLRCATVAIFIIAIGIRLGAWHGYGGTDDGVYARVAHELRHGHFVGMTLFDPRFPEEVLPHQIYRFGVTLPLALIFKITENYALGMGLLALLFSLANLGLLGWLAHRLGGWSSALVAMALYTVMPIDVKHATFLFPDTAVAFFCSLSLAITLFGMQQSKSGALQGYALASGFILGLAWLTKETAIYSLIGLSTLVLFLGKPKQRFPYLVKAAATFLGVVALESLFHYLHSGEAFARWQAIELGLQFSRPDHFFAGSVWGWQEGHYLSGLARRLFAVGPSALLLQKDFGFVLLMALIVLLHQLLFPNPRLKAAALWLAPLLVFQNFGTTSCRFWQPPTIYDPRYMIYLLIPAILLLALFVGQAQPLTLFNPARRRQPLSFWALVLLIPVLLSGGWYSFKQVRQERAPLFSQQVAETIRPSSTIYTDYHSQSELQFFWNFADFRTVEFAGMTIADFPVDSIVVVNYRRLNYAKQTYGYNPPAIHPNIPTHWDRLWESSEGVVLKVKATSLP